jgi:hypothetical protein
MTARIAGGGKRPVGRVLAEVGDDHAGQRVGERLLLGGEHGAGDTLRPGWRFSTNPRFAGGR